MRRRNPSALRQHLHLVETLESRTHLSATTKALVSVAGTIDLTGAVMIASNATPVKQGRALRFAITITNAGTATASGRLEVDAGLSSASDGAVALSLGALRTVIHLKPGGSQTLHFVHTVPVEIPAGTYYCALTVDPNNSFEESNTSNNSAVSSSSITVQPLYPVLASVYSGTVNVMGGPDRGEFGEITTYITAESGSGLFSGDGTVLFENGVLDEFNIQGRISQAGTITERILVSTGGNVSLVTAALSGGTIAGTYRTQGDFVRFIETGSD